MRIRGKQMIESIGVYTLTGSEPDIFNALSGKEREGYSLGDFRDKVVLGATAKDYWASQNEEMQKAASASHQSVERILNAATGIRSGADFLSDKPVEASAVQIPVEEFGIRENTSTATGNGLTINVATLRDHRGSIVNSTITVHSSNGLSFSLDSQEDVRMQEQSDGSVLVEYPVSGKSLLYMADGSMKEIARESAGWNDDADSAYIKLSKDSHVSTGCGNDAILILEGGGAVSAGAGNDRIVLSKYVSDTHLDAGTGDDTLDALEIAKSVSIIMGDGDDSVKTHINSGTVNLGDGNNTYYENDTGRSWDQVGRVIAGDGNNEIISRMASNIELGDGNNTIMAQFMKNVHMGNGSNTIRSEHINDMILGDGTNTIESVYLGNTQLGNGDNQIIADSSENYSTIAAGDGDNTFTVRNAYRANINAGDGNNILNLSHTNETIFNVGDGNNDIAIGEIRNNSSVDIGNGSNNIATKSMCSNASITIGNGNNRVGIGSICGQDNTITIGDGDNIIAAMWHPLKKYGDSRPPSVTIGNGNNKIYLEENFQMNSGSGANTFYTYAHTSGGYNAIQSWIDARIPK